jgi:hypothetical protein
MNSHTDSRIIFRKQDSVGVNDALDDKEFLLNCFIDLGDLQTLEDFRDPRCLVIGRTGTGKTALLTELQGRKGDKVIVIDAESLAMNYISNSSIVNGLMELGIDLNTFFKYLWRHVICVEILTKHVKITSQQDQEYFMERVRSEFKRKDPKHLKALDYLDQWKDTFWKTSDSHVAEMTNKIEDKISGEFGVNSNVLKTKFQKKASLSSEETVKIKERGQSIVNDMQMKEVTGLLAMLDDFIEFHQTKYYVVIDKLDEKWVGNSIRYRLIKSLIETVKDLNRLENIKPVATLRYDLIGRVFDITRDSGFQEEKFNSLFVNIRWTNSDLLSLINQRINYLFKLKYSKKTRLTIDQVFPKSVDGEPVFEYLTSRTLMRPRDLIDFVNTCIRCAAEEDGYVSESVIRDAEVVYSRGRLESLNYEWGADYPALKEWAKLLQKRPAVFTVKDLSTEEVIEMGMEYAANPIAIDIDSADTILNLCNSLIDNKISSDDFKLKIVYIFYRVSLVGLRESGYSKINWSYSASNSIHWDDIDMNTEIHIHPCFQSALKITQ